MSEPPNRNADLHLADALGRDIENTPAGGLLNEAAEDFGDRRALAKEFDAVFARAVALDRRRRVADFFKAFGARLSTLPSWRPATAAALAVALIAGAVYLVDRSRQEAATERSAEVSPSATRDRSKGMRGLARVEPDSPGPVAQADEPQLDVLEVRIAELKRAGDFAAAEASAKRYLVLAKSSYGEEHPKYAAGLISLAEIYASHGRYAEAEPLLKRNLAIAEKALGPDHLELGNALNSLAGLYESQGRYTKALEWYEKAAGTGNTVAMTNIGVLYANGRGVPRDYAAARKWYAKAAAAGHAKAMGNLSGHRAKGRGMPRDYATPRELPEMPAAGDRSDPGDLSWYALFTREFALALDAAERELKADPQLLWIAANRAHALMYLDRAAEAREAYLMHRDKQIVGNESKIWQQVIAEDFEELRKAGLNHPQMAEIEAALGMPAR
jgi:TPR repeat protein